MKNVFVVGAGPAGLFAAQKIASAGHQVFVFNRDIKPGGLAEYGIDPLKTIIKRGWRNLFAKILALPNVRYLGNVKIGSTYDLTVEDLRRLGPSAILFACGAQGYHGLGLPGENAKGVYAAKDFVYHYNQLPPYASLDFSTGKRIAVVGMGNVAGDITRWLLDEMPARPTEEVIVMARRGPYEAKFSDEELESLVPHLNRDEFIQELARIKEHCEACNQDVSIEKVSDATFHGLREHTAAAVLPKLTFRFLSSPKEILKGPDGRIRKLIVTENTLVLRGDGNKEARDTAQTAALDVDTLIFAIGDKQDPLMGLPMGPDGYATKPNPESPADPVYELWDPATGKLLDGFYVAGWARKPSTGLVGIARRDGEKAASRIIEYLKTLPDPLPLNASDVQSALEAKGIQTVDQSDLQLLGRAEEREASARNLDYFKYSANADMLDAIARERATLAAAASMAATFDAANALRM